MGCFLYYKQMLTGSSFETLEYVSRETTRCKDIFIYILMRLLNENVLLAMSIPNK